MACMARFLGLWALYLNRPFQDQWVMGSRQVGEQPKDEPGISHGPSPRRHLRPFQASPRQPRRVGRRDQAITGGIPSEPPANWWTPLLSFEEEREGVEWARDVVNLPMSSSGRQ